MREEREMPAAANPQENTRREIQKIIPSPGERGLQKLLYRLGKYLPAKMTPNQMTAVGAFGGLFAVLSLLLARVSMWFFAGAIAGVIVHIVADDLDGYIARTRNMSSKAGAYFDLITDVMFCTFFLIALPFSGYVHMQAVILLVPGYAIIIVTMMNYILHFGEFLFPLTGPFEVHITYILCAAGAMLFGKAPLLHLWGLGLTAVDILLLAAVVPVYFEMIRLQIQLFLRLKAQEADAAAGEEP